MLSLSQIHGSRYYELSITLQSNADVENITRSALRYGTGATDRCPESGKYLYARSAIVGKILGDRSCAGRASVSDARIRAGTGSMSGTELDGEIFSYMRLQTTEVSWFGYTLTR